MLEDMMEDSIWGDLDTDEIPDDPNYVAPGTYFCQVTSARFITDKEDPSRRIAIAWTWKIDEPDSDYHNFPLNEYFNLPRSRRQLERDGEDSHSPREIQDASRLKVRFRDAFGMSPEEIKYFSDPDDLVGKSAYVTSTVRSSKDPSDTRKFINVTKAISPEKHAEEMARRGSELSV
jgi:hypothetical protein